LKFVCIILNPVFSRKISPLCRTDFYIVIEFLQLINDNYDNFTKNQKKQIFTRPAHGTIHGAHTTWEEKTAFEHRSYMELLKRNFIPLRLRVRLRVMVKV
jgi:hypothetical protein